ncbi:MAG TPA: DUF4350 domain-containing protein, partial [Candidatus Angelobacter sp.]|nr:DUF4350 domain-containing protein [Candidatus Angelobacter sp.]
DPAHTVLVLASPFRAPTRDEKNALQLYLSRGGKILATGANVSSYLPDAETDSEPLQAPSPKDYEPQLLTPLTRGGTIQMSPAAYWKGPSTGSLAHYADEGRPIVVSYRVGNGEVIWWGANTPLTNAGISKAGNMALLLNSLGGAGNQAHAVHILWDEYFHAESSSVSDYFFDPPLKYGFLQFALVFIALIFTFSRRNGPIHPLPEPSRLSPLEFVHTLGKLYRRANAVHSALEIPYTRFRMLATRRLGLNADIPAAELAHSVKNRLNYKDDSFAELLQQIEAALHNPELTEAGALALVQQLNRHTQNLKLISAERQETTLHADRVPGAHARTN